MSDDLIKRSDAIKAVREYANLHTFNSYHQGMLKAISIIADIPTADRPQGEWIEQEDDYHHYWECSECGMGVGLDDIRNFCPNCGADMKGADDE